MNNKKKYFLVFIICIIFSILIIKGKYQNNKKTNIIYITNTTSIKNNDIYISFSDNDRLVLENKNIINIPENFSGNIKISVLKDDKYIEEFISGYYEYNFRYNFKVIISENINKDILISVKEISP